MLVVEGIPLPRIDFVVAVWALYHISGLTLVSAALVLSQVVVDVVGSRALAALELFRRFLRLAPGNLGSLRVGGLLGHVVNFVEMLAFLFPEN